MLVGDPREIGKREVTGDTVELVGDPGSDLVGGSVTGLP